jgi:hypothetical protein
MNDRGSHPKLASPESSKSSLFLARIIDRVNGKHGPYAVTILPSGGKEFSVTFSLGWEVWKEDIVPERGTTVVLGGLIKKKAGWRASSARLYSLLDALVVFANSREFEERAARSRKKETEHPARF